MSPRTGSFTTEKSSDGLPVLIFETPANSSPTRLMRVRSLADAAEAAPTKVAAASTPEDAAVSLVQAMYANKSVDGYELRQRSLKPVYVGDLKVQMISEYRGEALTGRVLRIENKGTQEKVLTEAQVAPASALAVSIAEPKLAPGRVTTAYLVSRNGN